MTYIDEYSNKMEMLRDLMRMVILIILLRMKTITMEVVEEVAMMRVMSVVIKKVI